MPWLWILFLIAGMYLAVKIVQGAKEFASWLADNRMFAEEQKRARQRHRAAHPQQIAVPALKERSVTMAGRSACKPATEPAAKVRPESIAPPGD
ncbi:MAG: hypothetical protein ABSG68_10760 [Thermoguttaceae bacterium]|jgi:hypothetical protein